MASDRTTHRLQEQLFADRGLRTYVLLDGASVRGLRWKFWELRLDHYCLFAGDLEPDMATVAPYVAKVEPDAPFTKWVLSGGWGKHWGVFAFSSGELHDMRQHFRKIVTVYSPEGKPLYFRFYDPRVLRTYLPTCTPEELEEIFGPVERFALESPDADAKIRFRRGPRGLETETVDLPAGASG